MPKPKGEAVPTGLREGCRRELDWRMPQGTAKAF